ncbi:hypothetical protein RCO28_34715 [Streptomyces sp. LHD-70]|uniref:DUF6573 family protein n=1 Tax=Streptomyces sp. LHD-70 TaxID=3072140 RepID=UPI00280E98B0|nr:DUF6573 family protein [Streptomyces sp. LHD-70]MDQ8707587.1 hypothetical protein [Streptomyces sp. LHD-70]
MTDQPITPGTARHDFTVSSDAMRNTPHHDGPEHNDLTDLFGPVIHTYTRAQAIADGALVEPPTGIVREAGFRVPLAFTAAAWADCVAWTSEDNKTQTLQDETGRLWDVLWMTRFAITRSSGTGNRVTVELNRVPRDGHSQRATLARLVAEVGPGDQAEPVMTLMLPDES